MQYHWGGGTPTYLSVEQMRALQDKVSAHFEFEPDAVLTKEVLPGMNGRGLARHARELSTAREIPIILYDDTRTVDAWIRSHNQNPEGVTEYVPTSEVDVLVKALRHHLGY